jgi:hypothetical protein
MPVKDAAFSVQLDIRELRFAPFASVKQPN